MLSSSFQNLLVVKPVLESESTDVCLIFVSPVDLHPVISLTSSVVRIWSF